MGNEDQTLEDHVEEYVASEVTCERPGHPSGAYCIKPGQKVKVGELLGEIGCEFGMTTGRRRRCGWLDIPLVKYSALVNGFSSVSLTKLDVLTGLKQIRIAVAYRNADMTEVRLPSGYFPSHLSDLQKVVCEYETLQG